jgi:hypothetical protein
MVIVNINESAMRVRNSRGTIAFLTAPGAWLIPAASAFE